jgi:hypothetical protein
MDIALGSGKSQLPIVAAEAAAANNIRLETTAARKSRPTKKDV